MPDEKLDAQTSQGAVRAARVLTAVATNEWSLSELARQLDVERRTLGRVISGLEREGYVSRNRAGHLQPGPRFVSVARAVSSDYSLAALARDVVADLCRATESTSVLHLPHGEHLFAEVIQTPQDALAVMYPRARSIELWRGIGRAYLQHSSDTEIARLAAKVHQEDLLDRVREERGQGFAVSRGELVPAITAIGAPVLDGDTVVAVLAVVSLDPQLPEKHGEVLLGAARRLARMVERASEDA